MIQIMHLAGKTTWRQEDTCDNICSATRIILLLVGYLTVAVILMHQICVLTLTSTKIAAWIHKGTTVG